MPDTSEINRILGELQQEIQNIRDSEVTKLVKPFVEKTDELIRKIESIDFPKRLDGISEEASITQKHVIELNGEFVKFNNQVIQKFNENTKKVNILKILALLLIFLSLINTLLFFIK